MKIKTLVAAVLLLSGGATSVFAQNDCNANSSMHKTIVMRTVVSRTRPCGQVTLKMPMLRVWLY